MTVIADHQDLGARGGDKEMSVKNHIKKIAENMLDTTQQRWYLDADIMSNVALIISIISLAVVVMTSLVHH